MECDVIFVYLYFIMFKRAFATFRILPRLRKLGP